MILNRWRFVVLAGILGSVPGLAQDPPKTTATAQETKKPQAAKPVAFDAQGDPLPAEALARLGTLRWRHASPVNYLAFLSDGKKLLTASQDQSIRLWEVATGKELKRFSNPATDFGGEVAFRGGPPGGGVMVMRRGLGGQFRAVLSSNGKVLAIAGRDQAIRLLDPDTGKETGKIPVPQDGVGELAISPDGGRIASKGYTGAIHVWDTNTAKEIYTSDLKPNQRARMFGTAGTSATLQFSADGKKIATVNSEFNPPNFSTSLKVLDVETGQEAYQIKNAPQNNAITLIQPLFSPDGKTLIWSTADSNIHVGDAATGKEVRQIKNLPGGPLSFVFSPDGKELFIKGMADTAIQVWDVASGKKLRQLGKQAEIGFSPWGGLSSTGLALSADGTLLALAGEGNSVRILKAESGEEVGSPLGHQTSIASLKFSPDGKTVTTRGRDGATGQWDARTGKALGKEVMPPEPSLGSLSPDERTLAVTEFGKGIKLLEMPGKKERATIPLAQNTLPTYLYSPNSKLLAVRTNTDPSVGIYDTATGKELHRLGTALKDTPAGIQGNIQVQAAGPGGMVAMRVLSAAMPAGNMTFSPDGKLLLAPNQEGRLELWDIETARALYQLPVSQNRVVRGVCFSPDSRSLAVDGGEDSVTLYEVATGKERRAFAASNQAANPDPAAGEELMLRRMLVMQGIGMLDGNGPVLTFSPDGKMLAHANSDRTLGLWEVSRGDLLGKLQGHRGDVTAVAFAGDGKTLATGSTDTTALVWDLTDLRSHLKGVTGVSGANEVEDRWNDLMGNDGTKAFSAINALAAVPQQAVRFLQERLKPAAAPDTKLIDQWISELDSNKFAARQKASKELEKQGELATPALQQVLANHPTPETRKRVEELLTKVNHQALNGERLRLVRAIEVLEQTGTPEARDLLALLAKGAPGALTTRAAQTALEHLGH
jgi:WD40 repeat protein